MVTIATKDPSEKEEEEVERLVRKSPTEKAPRPDKERERIEVEDKDVDEDDKDMSMNYKDIGGSIILAKWVATSYLRKVAIDFPTETAYETYMEEHPKSDPSNHTIDGESATEVMDKPVEDPLPKKEEKPEPKPKPKPKPEDIAVEGILEMEMESLYDVAETGSPEEQQAALEAIKQRKKPLPPGLPPSSEFTGELDDKSVEGLKKQIQNWDAMDYSENMLELQTDYGMAQIAGNERDADYFKSVMKVYEDESAAVRTVNLREVEDPSDLIDAEDLDSPFDDTDSRHLQKQRQSWYQAAMFSPLNEVGSQLSKVQEQLESVDPDSKKGVYLQEMADIMEDVRDRKMFDKNSISDRLLMGIRDADSPALKELDPGDFDLTNPEEVSEFIDKVSKLDASDIATLVKDEPIYKMHFSFDADDPSGVHISEGERRSFLDALREDLSVRGTFEQLRFHDDEKNSVFDKGSLLEFRDKALEDMRAQGIDFSSGSGARTKSFWDTFLDWTADMSEKLSYVQVDAGAKAVHAGITNAFRRAGLVS